MEQCVNWTGSDMFDRLRTEITLGSCCSIACACVSRIEPEMETEWIQEDSMKTELNGLYLTKEEIDKFGQQIRTEGIVSQTTESIIERINNTVLLTTDTKEDELTRSDDSGLEVSLPTRRDSVYVTDSSLEGIKRKLKERRVKPSDSPVRTTKAAPVESSYSQIWMCGRDKKKGLLAVFILPDDQKQIFVSKLDC